MESENYYNISLNYLRRALERGSDILKKALPGTASSKGIEFRAFGTKCVLSQDGVMLNNAIEKGPRSIIISMYALNAPDTECTFAGKWISFKDLPGTMPYWDPFRANAELVLVPYVEKIHENVEYITNVLDGYVSKESTGDFAIVTFPLPKVPLLYIFYLPDEEFPAEAKCLFASGVETFMPSDVLADLAEQTSKLILELIGGHKK